MRPLLVCRSVGFALLSLAALGAPARAEPIVVLGAEAVGVPDAEAVALTEALRVELKKRPKVEVMPGKDYVEMRLLFGCTEEAQLGPCMAQVGKSLVADRLVLATLRGDTATAKASGKVEVQIRLLDVATGKFIREVSEPVAPAQLAQPQLQAGAARWVAQLLGEAVATAPGNPPPGTSPPGAQTPPGAEPPVEKPAPGSRGRGLIIAGSVAVGLALVAGAAGIGTGVNYLDLRDEATAQRQSFANERNVTLPAQSDCTPPMGSTSTLSAMFTDQCKQAQTMATVTTALFVTAGVLAVGGGTLIALGVRARRDEAPPTPRVQLFPSISPAGARLALAYTF